VFLGFYKLGFYKLGFYKLGFYKIAFKKIVFKCPFKWALIRVDITNRTDAPAINFLDFGGFLTDCAREESSTRNPPTV